jgi:hypothetical protein
MSSMMEEQRNWHYDWIKRTIERMEEREQHGEKEVVLQIGEFKHIISSLLAMHQRSDRLEDVLCSYARYAFPVTQSLDIPTVFGGNIVGRIDSSKPNLSNVPKERIERERSGLADRRKNGAHGPNTTDNWNREQHTYKNTNRSLTGDRRIKKT